MIERDVWSFYESLGGGDRTGLTQIEREIAAICDLRQEVNGGGFDVYFRYWGGDTAEVAADAIGRLLGEEWAAVLSEAMAKLGQVYPSTVAERETVLTDAVSAAFEAFDERYFLLEASTNADELLSAALAGGT